MKFILLLFAGLATGMAMIRFIEDPGYVLISRQPWAIETTLTVFILTMVILFGIVWLLIRLLTGLFETPARLGRWSSRRHVRQALDSQHKGLVELVAGNWWQAEKVLLKHVGNVPHPDINYLAAAWSAQQRGDTETRDDMLARAGDIRNSDALATGIVQCQLQMQSGQIEQALATAQALHDSSSSNRVAIRLLLQLLEQTGEWTRLIPLLATADKLGALPEQELEHATRRVIEQMLDSSKDIDQLDRLADLIPRKLRREEYVVAATARALNRLQAFDRSETLLRTALKNHWSDTLVELYGEASSSDPAAQLKHAEKWAADHPLSTPLMLTLGRLAMRNQLWGMARSYLEVAVRNDDSAQACLEMGWLLEMLEDEEQARAMYRRGLELMTGSSRDQSIPDQITRVNTSSEEDDIDASVTHAPSLVYSNESK